MAAAGGRDLLSPRSLDACTLRGDKNRAVPRDKHYNERGGNRGVSIGESEENILCRVCNIDVQHGKRH